MIWPVEFQNELTLSTWPCTTACECWSRSFWLIQRKVEAATGKAAARASKRPTERTRFIETSCPAKDKNDPPVIGGEDARVSGDAQRSNRRATAARRGREGQSPRVQ